MNKLFLGEPLLKEEYITYDQLSDALDSHNEDGRSFEKIFVENGYISENDLLKVVSHELGYGYMDKPMTFHQPSSSKLISESYARANNILPLYIEDGKLVSATSEPLNFNVFEEIAMISGLEAKPFVSEASIVESAIEKAYSFGQGPDEILEGMEVSEEDKELLDRVASAPVIKMVNSMVTSAYKSNASDLHINPEDHFTRIRFRIDGELQDLTQAKKRYARSYGDSYQDYIGMNIAEKRIPQDGAFTMNEDGISVDIRVASIPTKNGKKLELRLLSSEKSIDHDLDKLDFDTSTRVFLKKLITIPNGIVLITGPTGSGKTTTLYSMLNELATPAKAVISIEDPVEKYFEGMTQVHINNKAGLTFASGLRSILRLDPDVIMLGEIRDSETADIAIRAAITGHIVLSSLHTIDALSAITRLVDMGVEAFMVASSVKCVIAQRRVRKNCSFCKEEVPTTHDDRILLGDSNTLFTYKGRGCKHCNDTGYSGRKAVFEVLPINKRLQEMIANRATYSQMKDRVVNHQQLPLLKDDVIRVLKGGDTSIQEAKKVLFNNDIFND